MTERLRDLSWCLCAVCGGEAPGAYGYNPPGGKPQITCEVCWPIRREAWDAQFKRSSYDREARDYAGIVGGAYLVEKIGTTDLAALTPEQWAAFLDTIFRAKQTELRRLYSWGAPPL